MYICSDCNKIFEKTISLTEDYGEERDCCSFCGGSYVKTYECCVCEEVIKDEYLLLGEEIYCPKHYMIKSIWED